MEKVAPRAIPSLGGWTTLAPVVCAVHCAAAPLLVLMAPTVGLEAPVEWTLLLVTAVLAALALRSGHRIHGDLAPTILILGGIFVWVASMFDMMGPVPHVISTPLAALTAASGLLWNSRLLRRHVEAGCACVEVDRRGVSQG